MRAAFVIAEKDLKTYFQSPLFYAVAGVCAIIWSLIFGLGLFQFQDASMNQMIQAAQDGSAEGINFHRTVIGFFASTVNLVMLIASAALSMRLLAEEKRQRTFDLLLTSPVTATDIAVGKWIAGTVASWALLAVSLIYPLSVLFFAKLEWGPLAATYFGLMLITGVYVAVGLFASSLTESPVLAVIMAILFNFMLFFVSSPANMADGPTAKAVFEQMNINAHLNTMIFGGVAFSSLAYLASLIFLFTLLTQRVVESARWR